MNSVRTLIAKTMGNKINDPIARLMGLRYKSHPWHGVDIGPDFPEVVTAFIEMVHPSVNKAESLRRVCELYGVAREDVMAIGDGGNDAEMIRWAGTGVAMGNARDSVKEAADVIAPPNTEDGAAQIIEAALAAEE